MSREAPVEDAVLTPEKLSDILAEATDTDPEEIERCAAEFEIHASVVPHRNFLRYWKGGQVGMCEGKAPGRSTPLTPLGSVRHPGTGRLASLVFRGPARLARGTLAALLASLWCLRRPGWIERPGPFFPTRVRMCVQLTAVAGRIGNMGGTGRGRLLDDGGRRKH